MDQGVQTMGDKASLPPGSLIHVGRDRGHKARLAAMIYDKQTQEEILPVTEDDLRGLVRPGKATWLRVQGVHDAETVGAVGEAFGLHPLLMEDVMNTKERPKLEDYDHYLFMILKILRLDKKRQAIEYEQLSIVVCHNLVISFVEADSDPFDEVAERLRQAMGRLRITGADYLAYRLLDLVIDGYFVVIEQINDRVDALEQEIMRGSGADALRRLHRLRRLNFEVRKAVWPLREILGKLVRGASGFFTDKTAPYLRDAHDHLWHVEETAETLWEILNGLFEIHLSMVGNRLNEVMKWLAMIATLFIPMTVVTGIYGMNFKNMPELGWQWSYPAVLIVLAMIAVGMLIFFRRKEWL